MFSKNCIESPVVSKRGHGIWHWLFVDYIRQTINHYNLCSEIKREREILAKLTDAELQDIGIHRADADAEHRRSFLDIPEDRLGLLAPEDRSDTHGDQN